MSATDPYRAYLRELREEREFAERAHKRQMVGNVTTSFFQSLATNRPLQVASAMGIVQLAKAAHGKIAGRQNFLDALGDVAVSTGLTAGMVGYLLNADGGSSVAYDIPDVESPRGVMLEAPGRGPFPSPADLSPAEPPTAGRVPRRRSRTRDVPEAGSGSSARTWA